MKDKVPTTAEFQELMDCVKVITFGEIDWGITPDHASARFASEIFEDESVASGMKSMLFNVRCLVVGPRGFLRLATFI